MKTPGIKLCAVLFCAFLTAGFALAHEKHQKPEEEEPPIQQEIIEAPRIIQHQEQEEALSREQLWQPSFLWKTLAEHPHSKVIHFPIALAYIAFLFLLLGYRYKFLRDSVGILVLISALTGIASYFTGILQIEEFMGEPEEWLALFHRNMGIATTASLWLWFITFYWKAGKKFSLFFAVLSVLLVTITSFLGGILAH
ncbi:MAG: hypothetical protein ACK4G3_06675 [bacterium]